MTTDDEQWKETMSALTPAMAALGEQSQKYAAVIADASKAATQLWDTSLSKIILESPAFNSYGLSTACEAIAKSLAIIDYSPILESTAGWRKTEQALAKLVASCSVPDSTLASMAGLMQKQCKEQDAIMQCAIRNATCLASDFGLDGMSSSYEAMQRSIGSIDYAKMLSIAELGITGRLEAMKGIADLIQDVVVPSLPDVSFLKMQVDLSSMTDMMTKARDLLPDMTATMRTAIDAASLNAAKTWEVLDASLMRYSDVFGPMQIDPSFFQPYEAPILSPLPARAPETHVTHVTNVTIHIEKIVLHSEDEHRGPVPLPESGCLRLDMGMALKEGEDKHGLWYWQYEEWHFHSFPPLAMQIIRFLYDQRSYRDRYAQRVCDIAKAFGISDQSASRELRRVRDFCRNQEVKLVVDQTDEKRWYLGWELGCCKGLWN